MTPILGVSQQPIVLVHSAYAHSVQNKQRNFSDQSRRGERFHEVHQGPDTTELAPCSAIIEATCALMSALLVTLRAKHSSAVYCNLSCLWRKDGPRAGGRAVFVVGGVCHHDNSKLCASIFTKLGL